MSSVAQVEANRRNCLLSTGPVTPEGKAACRVNATQHGLRSRSALAPGESRQEYEEFARALRTDLAPQGAAEEMLAQRVADQSWRLGRAGAWEAAILAETMGEGVQGERLEMTLRRLDLLRRYERAIEQGLHQALRELRAMQKARRDEDRARRREADLSQERRRRAAQAEAAETNRRTSRMVEEFIVQDQEWAAAREEEWRQPGLTPAGPPRPRQTEPIEEEDRGQEGEERRGEEDEDVETRGRETRREEGVSTASPK